MKQKLGLIVVLAGISSLVYAQQTNTPNTGREDNSSFTFSESQLNEDDDVNQSISALVSSDNDVYLSTAGYSFSPMRFRVRAYDSQYNDMYINGVHFNNVENGRFSYGVIGGLNDATRNKDGVSSFAPSRFGYNSFGGSTNIITRASQYAAGSKLSLSGCNRNYILRGMFTHSTGLMKNGWAFTGSLSYRWAKEGNIEGTFYNSLGYFLAAEKVFNDRHSLSITTWGNPTERGQQTASTQEVYDLAGSNYYNANWGYQDGQKRNARVVRSFEPTAILSWHFNIDKDTKLETSFGFKYSNYGTSALGWYNNVPDPRPDYWKKLPSYYTDARDKEIATDLWEHNKEFRQLDWDMFYNVNRQQNRFNDMASYIVEERHNDQLSYTLNSVINHTFNSHTSFTGGLELGSTKGMHYNKIKDMLGADIFYNIDKFSARDNGMNSDIAQNDLDNRNAMLKKGDKFGYDYNLFVNRGNIWAQGVTSHSHWDIQYGAKIGATQLWREGMMRNGRAANSSKGNSEKKFFMDYAAKFGVTYKVTGNHILSLNTAFENRAPLAYNSFVAPRMKNMYVNDLQPEKIVGGDLNYVFNFPRVHGRITGYYTRFFDQTELESFYDDDTHRYSYLSMKGINKEHWGVELGLTVNIISSLNLTGVATYSDARYTNNPDATLTYENETEVTTGEKVYCDGFRVNSTPLSVYSLALDYSIKGWFFNLNGNYYDRTYLDFSTIRRLSRVVGGPGVDLGGNESVKADPQQKLKGGFMMDASIGRYLRFKNGTSLSLNLSVNNILNNTNLRTGGYEQNRIDGLKYASKYYYAQGINAFLNVGYRF